jgi:fumarate reductase flavoprotein subunit
VAESTVFGGIAGDVMASFVAERRTPRVSTGGLDEIANALNAPRGRGGPLDLYTIQRQLREAMWDRAGLVRDAAGLAEARESVERIGDELTRVGVPGHPAFNVAWQDWLNLTNQAAVARLIVASALERRESRGAHYRGDFPSADPGPLYTVRVSHDDGSPRVRRAPVSLTRLTPPDVAPSRISVEIGD